MPDFNPSPRDRITIGGLQYTVMPHPAVPSFAFGQEGRKAFVYQITGGADQGLYALKKFKQAFRLPELVEICDQLARFAGWPGLEVCNRSCLHPGKHDDALGQHPDLEYAVLMPWISGSTWYDMVIGMTPVSRLEAIAFANAVAQVLAAIEEAGLAHCDISAANVIINPNTQRAHLIDVEDLYAPGFDPPAALPAGTEGYAHRAAPDGLWGPTGDRFAGAVLICEMLAWHVAQVRKDAEDEHYFSQDEMQQDCPRYRLMSAVLEDEDPRLADLFDRAWTSDTLADCPRMKEWQEILSELYHRERVAGVVSNWEPLTVPGVDLTAQPAAQPAAQPIVQSAPVSQPEPTAPPVEPEAAPETEQTPVEPPVPQQPAPTVQKQIPTAAPTLPPAAPPLSTPARPIQAAQQGGPVVEWVPLTIPQQPANGSHSRPIWQPPAEEPPAPPEEVAAPEAYPPAAETEDEEMLPVEVIEQAQPEPEAAPEATAEPDEAARAGLFKPLLDVSHIDERNHPHLVWSESPGAARYVLEEDDNPDFSASKEYRLKSGDTRWTPGLLWRRSGRLYYRIRAQSADLDGPWSDVVTVRIGGR